MICQCSPRSAPDCDAAIVLLVKGIELSRAGWRHHPAILVRQDLRSAASRVASFRSDSAPLLFLNIFFVFWRDSSLRSTPDTQLDKVVPGLTD